MKHLLLALLLVWVPAAVAAQVEVVDICVSGLACPFCVHSLEKRLGKVPGVERVTADLAGHAVRVVMQAGRAADVAALKKAIVEAGFTPGSATVRAEE